MPGISIYPYYNFSVNLMAVHIIKSLSDVGEWIDGAYGRG